MHHMSDLNEVRGERYGFKLKVVAFAKTSDSRSAGREYGISEYAIN